MNDAAGLNPMARDQNERIADVVTREQARLRNFIRRRVPDPRDAEDILQDVFYELVEANRLLMPIDHDEERLQMEDLLPSPDAGPESLYARTVLLEEIELALDELPDEQRDVFV